MPAGGAGSQVVPDLATAMPQITAGGRVYTFHLRSGVRFSPPVNRAVRPSDVKWSIERILKVNSPNVSWYTGHRRRDRVRVRQGREREGHRRRTTRP